MKRIILSLDSADHLLFARAASAKGMSMANLMRLLASKEAGFKFVPVRMGPPKRDWFTKLPDSAGGRVTGRFFTRDEAEASIQAAHNQEIVGPEGSEGSGSI